LSPFCLHVVSILCQFCDNLWLNFVTILSPFCLKFVSVWGSIWSPFLSPLL
jgi:hypothetical protein